MKSEVKEEIQTYIRYINENDLRDKCEEYIQMFFFLSQMMLEESLGADERVIQSMAQKMVGLLGQDLDIDFASPNDGMYGGLGVLTFSVHEIMGRTGELKETSELLDRFLLDQACQKADLFQQRKLSFGSYDGNYKKVMAKYANPVVLILDEWLLLKPTNSEQRDIFELLHRRRKKSSTIFCSQYAFEEWDEQLGGGDSPLADAIIDCIAHDSYRINITSIDVEHDRLMREVYGLDKELRE